MHYIMNLFPRLFVQSLLVASTLASALSSIAADNGSSSATKSAVAAASATAAGGAKFLIIRNNRSWNRKPDFEEALTELDYKYDVKTSAEMSTVDLSKYRTVIIPGAQQKDDFYGQYLENAELFNRYVTNGGTLLLELNGAENAGIPLPRGVTMARHGSRENAVILDKHPLVEPLNGQPIHANYASHGYLEGTPADALVLVTEMEDGKPLMNRPTYIEYPHGKGRIIAACQCFHDRDGSGRGILMETALVYTADRQWYKPKK